MSKFVSSIYLTSINTKNVQKEEYNWNKHSIFLTKKILMKHPTLTVLDHLARRRGGRGERLKLEETN